MILRFFRHGSNALLVVGIVAFALALLRSEPSIPALAIVLGIVLFFASEYGTHRFVLHAPPSPSSFVRGLQHRLHYDHHAEPERLDLLFLPPWFLAPVLFVFAAAYWISSRSLTITGALILGNLLGLLYYEWVHYVAHIPFRPRTPFGRWIKKYHLWHHFKSERFWFGVTNPLPDLAAGTFRRVEDVERSPHTRALFP